MKRSRVSLSLASVIIILLVINGIASTMEFNLGIKTGYRLVVLIIASIGAIYVLYWKSREIQIKVLLGLCFLGNEPFLLLLPILMLPKLVIVMGTNRRVSISQFTAIIFLLYSTALIAITNLIEPAGLNAALWFITFGAYILIYLYYSKGNYGKESVIDILGYVEKLILLQAVVMIAQALIHWDLQPGDSWTGTSGNAVLAGFFIISLLIVYFFPPFLRFRKGPESIPITRKIPVGLLLLLLLYFNDSKMVIMAFGAGLLFFSLFTSLTTYLRTGSPRWFWKITLTVAFSIALLSLIRLSISWYSDLYYDGAEISEVISPYISKELNETNTNGKAVIYHRVYADMLKISPLSWMFGVGPGRLGSKSANIMAYDVLHKEEDQLKMPKSISPYSSYWTKLYMSDLWTKEIAETSKYRSATLSFPFAGLVTLKAEYGLVGVVLYFSFLGTTILELWRKVQRRESAIHRWGFLVSLFWFTLPLLMIFDNFQEKNFIILPMFLLTAVLTSKRGDNSLYSNFSLGHVDR